MRSAEQPEPPRLTAAAAAVQNHRSESVLKPGFNTRRFRIRNLSTRVGTTSPLPSTQPAMAPSLLLRTLLVLASAAAVVADAHDGRDDAYKPANWVSDPLPPPPLKPKAAVNTTGCQTVLQVRHTSAVSTRGEASMSAARARACELEGADSSSSNHCVPNLSSPGPQRLQSDHLRHRRQEGWRGPQRGARVEKRACARAGEAERLCVEADPSFGP